MSFDPASEAHVALVDEMPPWSALAGSLLLDIVPMTARRVLDLGCGTGFPLLELAERLGPETLAAGLDPWHPALARARAKRDTWPVPHAGLACGDGAAMPFRDGAFDLVVSNLGVNNFAEPGLAFAECRRVPAPRGALALSTNLVGHFAELYETLAGVLVRAGDAPALERLRAHVAPRASRDHRGAAGIARASRLPRRVAARAPIDLALSRRRGAAVAPLHPPGLRARVA